MDIASLAGMLLGVVMFLFGVFSSGGASGLFNMFDFPSIIITLGGSISGTLASNKLQDFIAGLKSITLTFKEVPQDPAAVIRNIIDLSNTARKEGLLALEEAANGIEDEFLKKGIMLVVDGTDPELVRGIMETDLGCIEQRHKKSIAVWEKWGELGPAWGMIGTLIGLILMLKDMNDASTKRQGAKKKDEMNEINKLKERYEKIYGMMASFVEDLYKKKDLRQVVKNESLPG